MKTHMCVCARAAFGLALAVTSPAWADLVQYQGVGGLQVTAPLPNGVEFQFDAPVVSQLGGFNFTGFSGTATQVFSALPEEPDSVVGSGILTGPTPGDTLMVAFSGLGFGTNPGTASVGASAIFGGGTGLYAPVFGHGDFSAWVVFTSQTTAIIGITLQGDVVPAPGTVGLAVVACGVFATRRHRVR